MKTRHILLALVLLIAGWLALFGDKTPSSTIAEPIVRNKTTVITSSSATSVQAILSEHKPQKKIAPPLVILALINRDVLIGSASAEKKIAPASLFASQSWVPPPPPLKVIALPPPAPVAPPLPFSFLGKKNEDGQWEVYLARGEQTFIVRLQSVIENNYRVDAIKPPMLTLTYLPLNQVQTLTIGGTD